MAISSWSLVRVYGTWTDHQGMLLTGNYKIKVPTRLTNSAADIIIPAGVFASGTLNTTAGVPSLSVLCPSTDDPDIQQDGWLLEVEVTFTFGLAGEKYVIEVPISNRPIEDGGNGLGINLRTIALTSQLPPQAAMYGVGTAGGLAVLSNDGTSVLDSNGDPIASSGAETITGVKTFATSPIVPDSSFTPAKLNVSATVKSMLSAADAAGARTAIGAADAAAVPQVFPVDRFASPTEALAALVAGGGGVLLFTPGSTYTGVALELTASVPTKIVAYGATLKPPSGGTCVTFAAGRSQSKVLSMEGGLIDCDGLSAVGVKLVDHYGGVLRDITINKPTQGVLLTDSTGWTESSQLSNILVKGASVAGFDLQTAGGTGSFGYAAWNLVHADNIPAGGVGFRIGAGAGFSNSTIGNLVLHSTAINSTGMQVAGDLGYSTRIDVVIEALAAVMTGSVALDIVGGGTLSGCDLNMNILNPGTGGWATKVRNPGNRPFQARMPRNRRVAALSTSNVEETGVLEEGTSILSTQPMFTRAADGAMKWGPGSTTAPDVTLQRAGTSLLQLIGSLQITSGNLTPSGGMRLATGVTTGSGGFGTGSATLALVDASAGAVTRTLYTTTTPGFCYIVTRVNSGANAVNVAPPGGGTINGSSSPIVLGSAGESVMVFSTSTSGAWIACRLAAA